MQTVRHNVNPNRLLIQCGSKGTSLTSHVRDWKNVQASILGKGNSLQSKTFKYHRLKSAASERLFVFLTGIPAPGHFKNPDFFEWGRYIHEDLQNHNCLLVRDSNNFWYLDPSDIALQRTSVIEFIECTRRSMNIRKKNVTVVGCSAGATAALDVVSIAQYGKAIAFSAQLDFKADLRLLEERGETFRPRYEMEKQILRIGYYDSLLPSLLLSHRGSLFYLFWGERNAIDHQLHLDFLAKLEEKKNFHFMPVNTDSHNSAGAYDRSSMRHLLINK